MEKHPKIGRSLSIQKDTFGTEIVIEQYQLLPLIVLRGTFRGGHTGSALCRPRSEDTKRSLRHYFLGDELSSRVVGAAAAAATTCQLAII